MDGPRSAQVWTVRSEAGAPGQLMASAAGATCTVACATHPLADVAEVWGTALCLPAARAGAVLRLPGPVDGTWRSGVQANVAAAARWWGGDAVLRLEAPEPTGRFGRAAADRPAPGRALCFTGGVDSFFSLLVGDHRPTHLLYVLGFDVEVADGRRAVAVTAAVEDVAGAVGLEVVIARSDLRRHPAFASISWEHTHGAALAAVAHSLHPTIGTLVIPPSYATSRLQPWGSRPDLDPRWSVPGRLQVEHGDASGRRMDRVLAIAHHPLVHRHLRVCWQNLGSELNCGRCEKCVRTMVMLAGADQLQHCATFPDRADLIPALAAMPGLAPGHVEMWTDLIELDLRPDERRAVDDLLNREG